MTPPDGSPFATATLLRRGNDRVDPGTKPSLWLANLLAFQLGWWALVLSAAHGWSPVGLGLVALLLAWHLGRVRPRVSEYLLITLTALIGLCFDSFLLAQGWISFTTPNLAGSQGGDLASPFAALVGGVPLEGPVGTPGNAWEIALPPLWMTALWANFATTLNVCLVSLQHRPAMAAILGLVGGPLAYWGGAQLGAMTFIEPLPALWALALGWALLTPLLLTLAGYLTRRFS